MPLLPQMPHEDVQHLHAVCHIDGGPPGDDVLVDEAVAVKESEQHLFGLAGMDLVLYWARLPFLDPLLRRLFF
jgi:hypothetical protein